MVIPVKHNITIGGETISQAEINTIPKLEEWQVAVIVLAAEIIKNELVKYDKGMDTFNSGVGVSMWLESKQSLDTFLKSTIKTIKNDQKQS